MSAFKTLAFCLPAYNLSYDSIRQFLEGQVLRLENFNQIQPRQGKDLIESVNHLSGILGTTDTRSPSPDIVFMNIRTPK